MTIVDLLPVPVLRISTVVAIMIVSLGGCAVRGEVGVSPPPGVVITPGPGVVIGVPPPGPHSAPLDIPQGHYPPPGSCRIWIPGVPPGQQPPPGRCEELRYRVPPGAVLVRG